MFGSVTLQFFISKAPGLLVTVTLIQNRKTNPLFLGRHVVHRDFCHQCFAVVVVLLLAAASAGLGLSWWGEGEFSQMCCSCPNHQSHGRQLELGW